MWLAASPMMMAGSMRRGAASARQPGGSPPVKVAAAWSALEVDVQVAGELADADAGGPLQAGREW
jgi:hypothetical protein